VSSFLELGVAAGHPIPSPDQPDDPFWVANLRIKVHSDVQDATALRKACEYVARVCPAPIYLAINKAKELTDDMLLICARRALSINILHCPQITDASVQHLTSCKKLGTDSPGVTRASLENLPNLFNVSWSYLIREKRTPPDTKRWLWSMISHGLMSYG
jgi:hypothetical protein